MHSASSMMVEPEAKRPAMAKAIAIRWSPKLGKVVPVSLPPHISVRPSSASWTSTPIARRLVAIAAIRSVSLTLSSWAPR